MRKSASKNFQWKGRIETLEDRRMMSADPLLGGSIHHHFFEEEAPLLDHHLVAEPDFWMDTDNLVSIEDQLDQIEQTLYSAHNTTGLNSVVSNYGFTGIGQTVAVIDSGIAYDHFALGGGYGANYRVVGGWDFTGENDANPYDDGPEGSHGTHVAGIVGGSAGNDKGVAPGVDLVALRVFDDAGAGYFSWVENALRWVINNRTTFENPITAINLSLGVTSWNSSSIPSWSTLEDEFAQLESAGVFIAVSAGNSYSSYNTPGLSYPAASPYVVPVMSVTDGGVLAGYSQRHTRAIAAPGSAIRSTVPDYRGNNNGVTDDYANFSGTSMASPYIAGSSVLIRQAMEFAGYTNITQDMIHDHMMNTGTSFVDASTGLTFKRLNLQAAIDVLIPTDPYGSTAQTAYALGSLGSGSQASLDGIISTLTDADYFSFTAATSGTATLTASNMTHDMTAEWLTSGIAGTVGGNQGETFTFELVAGQSYTFGLSSGGGIGYYDLDISVENEFTYTDWGSVSYSQRNNISNNGETWYRVAASQAGYLTVESMFAAQSGQINLGLYNANMQQVAWANPNNGTCRVDAYATAGQEFYLCVLGNNADVDFRLSNLVSVNGTTVSIAGTSGSDTLSFTAGSTHSLSINGITHSFNSIAVNAFNFNGGGGSDSITMTGTSGNETATLRMGTASFTGTGFVVNTLSTENVTVYDGGGNDQATFYDSAGDDVYGAWFNEASMYGNGYRNEVRGFDSTLALATSGGNDQAYFYDTAGNDVYGAWFNEASMYGTGYRNEVRGFDSTLAHATSGGNDQAYFYDTAGNDVYGAWFNQASMSGSGYRNEVRGFDSTLAQGNSGGNDQATFYDTTGDDVYGAWLNQASMYGNGYRNEVRGFDSTLAHATSGGNDQATFYDTAGDDVYVAWFNQASMSGSGYQNEVRGFDSTNAHAASGGNDQATFYDTASDDVYVAWFNQASMSGSGYRNEVRGFDTTLAHAVSGGNDQATFYDTAGDDVYVAWFNQASMSGTGYRNEARGFDRTNGYAISGGNDRAVFYDTAADDVYVAWFNLASMSGSGYRNEANGFDTTNAYAISGGNDRAVFYDTTGDDYLMARVWGAYLSGLGYYNEARDFEQVSAELSNGGNNTVDTQGVDYIFDLIGQWS